MSKRDVVVLGIARSAIGSFGGGLSDIEPCELAGTVMKEAVARSGVDPKAINYVTVGNTIPTESRFPYVARVASIQAGLSQESVAMALNRLCSSGLQAIVTTAQNILLNDCDYGIGGGVEVMSRAGYLSAAMRNGARMGDSKMIDMMVGALHDPFHNIHMGVTAENVAAKYGINRDLEMVRKVRTGRIVTVLESTCGPELEVMVGLQIECLRFYKAPSNPFSAENFAVALLQALETAIPDDQQQQVLLQVMVPSFAQALKSALRHYAKSMSRKLQSLVPVVERNGRWHQERRDEQFEPTVPAGL